MLGRLRMSLEQCVRAFLRLTVGIFRHPRQYADIHFYSRLHQHTEILEHRIKRLIEEESEKSENLEWSRVQLRSSPKMCKTVVLAYNAIENKPTVFRSYDHRTGNMGNSSAAHMGGTGDDVPSCNISRANSGNKFHPRSPGPASEVPLWKIARATCSRPNFFSPTKIDGGRYEDGGFFYRNPSVEMIHEVLEWNGADRNSLDCLVSLGCGVPERIPTRVPAATSDENDTTTAAAKKASARASGKSKRRSPLGKKTLRAKQERREKNAAYDSDLAHDTAFNYMFSMGKAYYRLDIESRIWDLPLDDFVMDPKKEFSRNARLEKEIMDSLNADSMRSKLSNCARRLVARRRARAAATASPSPSPQSGSRPPTP
ncbi:MAG: hypothetical protein Q9162_006412 [Coniocarpon cinnabarinum]